MTLSKNKMGVAGDAGSFSEEAGKLYIKQNQLKESQLIYLTDMEGVLAALELDEIEIGIFPVVNLRGGLVFSAFEAMGKHAFQPIHELWLNVQQCLLIKPAIRIDEVTQIVSHPQGLAQCQNYLQEYFRSTIQTPWEDTAKAAKDLSEGKLHKYTAVIASKACAELYGLNVYAEGVQDHHPNLTAFIVAKQRQSEGDTL